MGEVIGRLEFAFQGQRRRLLALTLALFAIGATEANDQPKYAQNFSVERHDSHTVLRVRNAWSGIGSAEQVYALVPREGPALDFPRGTTVVRVPVRRLAIMETVYLGPIQALELHEALVGIAHVDLINDPIAIDRVERGLASRVSSGAALDVESMMMLKPDLVFASSTGNSAFDSHPALQRAGIPVALMADYMESHPLARAEWIKFVAAFFGKDAEAAVFFEQEEARYMALAALVEDAPVRPTVFSNAPYGGVWHVPGGRSYSAQVFADAGARYLWSEDMSSGGKPVDVEVIIKRAAQADFWLNPSHHDSLAEVLAADERFGSFAAVRHKRVYNNTKRVNDAGGNEIWERGVSRPHEVLADMIKIFHPDLLPEHEFVYYERLQ